MPSSSDGSLRVSSTSPEETQFKLDDLGNDADEKRDVDGQPGQPLSGSWRAEPLSSAENAKVLDIIKACQAHDLARLAELGASEDGFVEDEMRRRAWPMLLGCNDALPPSQDWGALPPHREEAQVALDVNRAFVYYPTDKDASMTNVRRTALSDLIISTLRQHPSLSYFQGFHDIAQVLLLVLGLDEARLALPRLSLLKIRDFMLPTLTGTHSHLDLIPPILYAADPDLCRHLSGLQPFFALPATLTMFAHDIEEYGGIARLFDYLLSHEAVASVYLFAAIISIRRNELLEIEKDEPDMLFAVLSKLPKPLDIEELIRRGEGLMSRFPPEKLPFRAWGKVSRWSVLKTTRNLAGVTSQSSQQGESWLTLQAGDIERAERRKAALARMKKNALAYRRPAAAVAIAVLVGVISIWLGREGVHAPYATVRAWERIQHRIMYSVSHFFGMRI